MMIPAAHEEQDMVYGLAASPGGCFAARHSGLYQSDDGGVNWRFAFEGLNLGESVVTLAVALSPDDQTVIAGIIGGVVRSSDAGKSWQVTTFRSPPPAVATIGISPNFEHDSIVLAGTVEDGIFRSTDGGRLWKAANFGLLDLNVLALAMSPDFGQDEKVYAGTSSGMFRSANGGLAWREVDLPCGFEPVLSLAIAHNGGLLAGTETQGLLQSTDQGKNWSRLGQEVITGAVNQIVLTQVSEILVVHEGALLISRGRSWEQVHDDVTAVSASAPLLIGTATGQVQPL
jgi:photosystem II stability/assembly factor-like uncharacterized protein